MIAVGTVTGAITMARSKQAPKLDFTIKSAIALGIVEVIASLMPTYWTFAAMLPLMGFATMMVLTTANAFVQSSVPDQLRGRVMGLYLMIFLGGSPLGSPIIGKISQDFGARYGLAVGGAVCAFAALVILLIVKKRILNATETSL